MSVTTFSLNLKTALPKLCSVTSNRAVGVTGNLQTEVQAVSCFFSLHGLTDKQS